MVEIKDETKVNAEPVKEKTAPVEEQKKEVVAKEEIKPTPSENPESGDRVPDDKELTKLITALNEIGKLSGGKGDISSIPEDLKSVVTYMMDKLYALRDAFEDPLVKDVLDDMVDQREDGKTPSFLVAVARNVAMEELQDLVENENYGDMQSAIDDRLKSDADSLKEEEDLTGKFDESKANIEAYCKEVGKDEAETDKFYANIAAWRDVWADGLITKEECAKIDKMENYDADTSALREQIPAEPTKEILPDKASIESSMQQPTPEVKQGPANSIESMATMNPITDITDIGKRKRK